MAKTSTREFVCTRHPKGNCACMAIGMSPGEAFDEAIESLKAAREMIFTKELIDLLTRERDYANKDMFYGKAELALALAITRKVEHYHYIETEKAMIE